MRKTATTDGGQVTQKTLDTFWNLIEDKFDEDWHVAYNGDVTLEVDEALLERILASNPTVALTLFGAFEDHNPENEKYEWYNLPEFLLGTYTIQGIYAPDLSFIKGDYQTRTYYFEQA
jgi:hypothetical protein